MNIISGKNGELLDLSNLSFVGSIETNGLGGQYKVIVAGHDMTIWDTYVYTNDVPAVPIIERQRLVRQWQNKDVVDEKYDSEIDIYINQLINDLYTMLKHKHQEVVNYKRQRSPLTALIKTLHSLLEPSNGG